VIQGSGAEQEASLSTNRWSENQGAGHYGAAANNGVAITNGGVPSTSTTLPAVTIPFVQSATGTLSRTVQGKLSDIGSVYDFATCTGNAAVDDGTGVSMIGVAFDQNTRASISLMEAASQNATFSGAIWGSRFSTSTTNDILIDSHVPGGCHHRE
jgi:hypothetical protein